MIKIYSSPCLKFTVNVKKDGKSFPVVFDRWNAETRRRWIVISDPDIQRQMESLEDFNVYYTLDEIVEEVVDPIEEISEEVITPEPVIEVDKPLDVKKSGELALKKVNKKDFVEAKRWLNTLGIPYTYMKNKETLIALAKEQGYALSLGKQQ
jgi:hypothetical protein